MGFTTLIDIIGSMIIGGMVMLLLFRLNDAAAENVYNNTGELIAQENIATLVSILEHDFRKMGYSRNLADFAGVTNLAEIVTIADSDRIRFKGDVDENVGADSVEYYIGPTSEIPNTANPRDRYLYRVINDETPVRVNLGLTHFKLKYFDGLGEQLLPYPVVGGIQRIQIDIAVENVYAYDSERYYKDSTNSQVFWRQIRLSAQNLRNR
ncbi:MAG TPA: hypothetical protein VMT35_16985 [Ignavibacteriaceae bacterium]|nr:hypothetical protein [Ignavibacteriaceae bacterium]